MRFSKSTGCFYPHDVEYIELPADLVAVSQEEFSAAMSRAPGDTLDLKNGRVVVVSRPAPNAAEIRRAQWERIKAERDRRIQFGGYRVGSKWFHSDNISRTQQLGLVLLGGNVPSNLMWKTMGGSFVSMTQELAQQILSAAAANDQVIFSVAEAHFTKLEASANPEDYAFLDDWPESFDEAGATTAISN